MKATSTMTPQELAEWRERVARGEFLKVYDGEPCKDCGAPHAVGFARGWCGRCYHRHWARGEFGWFA